MNTLLVDAAFLFKKSFLGGKNIYSRGKSIGGLFTFIAKLRTLHTRYSINKIVLCWDGENSGKARYLVYDGYKANRESKSWYNKIGLTDKQIYREENSKESELWQKVRIKQYAEELFIRQVEVNEIEGDDLIAYYCLNKEAIESVIIYTNDRDFSQLLSIENTSIHFDNLDQLIDKDNYEFYFNHHYKNSLVLKILCGDTSDNVNGVHGLGEKTIIKHFPEIKDRHVMVNEIILKSKIINEKRILNKKNPIQSLSDITISKKLFIRNKKLMDLSKPFINNSVIEEYDNLYSPLNPENRGSSNLIKLMNKDGFFDHLYKNNFTDFVKPFYNSICKEIEIYNEEIGKIKRKKNSML